MAKVAAFKLAPEHLDPAWPATEEQDSAPAITARIDQALRYGGNWTARPWTWASNAWMERTWAKHGQLIVQRLGAASSWYAEQQRVPAVVRGALRVLRGVQLALADVFVLPSTLAGWCQFLDLARGSGLKFGELEEAAVYWWDRNLPPNLLSAARENEPIAAK